MSFWKKLLVAVALALPAATLMVGAQVVGNLPFTLTNNTIADANQVMANFNTIVNDTNANAATAGVNSNITQITGLTTPLSPAQGGASTYTFGTSTGAANAQVIASPAPIGFVVALGRRITFVAGFTNTGATTFNVNATGALNVFKVTTSGISALSGGEIVAGTVVDAWYDGTQYVLLNASPQALVPTGTIADFGGVNIPSGWIQANGAAVSRTTQSALFAANTRQVAATTTATSASVIVPNSALFQIGWFVGGPNVTCNVTITGIPDATHITISAAAGTSGATTLDVSPYPLGDCTTTFNLPNALGRISASVDFGAGVITGVTCANSSSVGTSCGAQALAVQQSDLPNVAPAFTGIQGGISVNSLNTNVPINAVASFSFGAGGLAAITGNVQTVLQSTGLFTPSGTVGSINPGAQSAYNKLPPVILVYKIVKL